MIIIVLIMTFTITIIIALTITVKQEVGYTLQKIERKNRRKETLAKLK